MTLTTGFALYLSAATLSHGATIASTAAQSAPIVESAAPVIETLTATPEPTKNDSLEQYVKDYFAKKPILVRIAKCESRFRQFDDNGNVMRGMVPSDVGIMQINEHYHQAEADKLGLDLHTVIGNLRFAEWLYDQQGTAPWSSSQYCWSQ